VAGEGILVQLVVRVPRALRREVRLHCVTTETTLMDFVIQAITEKLKRDTAR
jgi:hypothetical protein